MHQYCSSLVYKQFVDQSESETTLQCTNSSSELKASQPSKSDHDVFSGTSFKPNTWQYHLVKLIDDTKGHSDKVKAEIKRFVADFLEKRASKKAMIAQVPSTNDVNTKKRARPATPIINGEFSSMPPFASDGQTKKRARQATRVITKEFSLELLSTSDGHTLKRARPITPITTQELSTGLPPTSDGLSKKRTRLTTPIIYKELSTGLPFGSDGHTSKKAEPISAVITVDKSLKNSKLATISSGLSPLQKVEPIQPTKICKPSVTENRNDENANNNERELKIIVTSPNCNDTPMPIQSSSRSCLNVSADADDEDDELDNEVAMILANGVPPTVGGYRPIPEYNVPRLIKPELANGVPPTVGGYRPLLEYNIPRLIQESELANGVPPTVGGYRLIPEYNTPRLSKESELVNGVPPSVGGYRPIPEYNIPRLIKEPEIKALDGEPMFLGQDVAHHQCGPTLRFTSKPNKGAIKITASRPCLYQNKKFDELEKVKVIQTDLA